MQVADGNGNCDWQKRLDHMEEILAGLLEHAQETDKRFDLVAQQIQALRASQQDTNTSVQGLIGASRDFTDRIPPESVR